MAEANIWGETPIEISPSDLEKVRRSLPEGLPEAKQRSILMLITEYARYDFPQLAIMPSPMDYAEAAKQIQGVSEQAERLRSLLISMSDLSEWHLADEIAGRRPKLGELAKQKQQVAILDEIEQFTTFLGEISEIGEVPGFQRRKGRPLDNINRLKTLDDLATILWSVTGEKEPRHEGRIFEPLNDPLFSFTSAMWPILFGRNQEGLKTALRKWRSKENNQYRYNSPIIHNIRIRLDRRAL